MYGSMLAYVAVAVVANKGVVAARGGGAVALWDGIVFFRSVGFDGLMYVY